jgi:hypothetical protein
MMLLLIMVVLMGGAADVTSLHTPLRPHAAQRLSLQ